MSSRTDPPWGYFQDLTALVGLVTWVDAAVDVRLIVICPMRNGRKDDEHRKDGGVFL